MVGKASNREVVSGGGRSLNRCLGMETEHGRYSRCQHRMPPLNLRSRSWKTSPLLRLEDAMLNHLDLFNPVLASCALRSRTAANILSDITVRLDRVSGLVNLPMQSCGIELKNDRCYRIRYDLSHHKTTTLSERIALNAAPIIS